MAGTVSSVRITALEVPYFVDGTIYAVSGQMDVYLGGVLQGTLLLTDPGTAQSGRFFSTDTKNIRFRNNGTINAPAIGYSITFPVASSLVSGDEVRMTGNSVPKDNYARIEYLDASDNVLGTAYSSYSVPGATTALTAPTPPSFWTDHHGTREVV